MSDWPEFDYVIVGAGSAGCVLANRLSADPAVRVLLLEAGPGDRGWKTQIPAALTYNLMNDRVNWYYQTEPQPQMNGRRLYWPRGRLLGGSSSLNAMVYIRGHALDYDRWVGEGAAGWSYAEVLPYFRRAETLLPRRRRLSRRRRPTDRHARHRRQPPVRRLDRRRRAGRLPRHARHERLPAGGHGADGHDHPRRPPLQHGARLSAAGHGAAQPVRAHALSRHPRPAGARPRRRGRVCPGPVPQAGAWRRAR